MNYIVLIAVTVWFVVIPAAAGESPAAIDTAERNVNTPSADAVSADTGVLPLRVVYFSSASCGQCRRVAGVLPEMVGRWGERVVLEIRGIDEAAGLNEFLVYCKRYGVRMVSPPVVFVGDRALEGDDAIVKQLDAAIDDALKRRVATFRPATDDGSDAVGSGAASGYSTEAAGDRDGDDPTAGWDRGRERQHDRQRDRRHDPAVPSEILRYFDSFAIVAVAVTGLFDGVNPCAFTTIVFFLSMLAYLKKTRRDMVLVGVGFTVGMFVAYFLIGLGLMGAVKVFSVHHGLAAGLAYVVAGLAFVLAGWSIVDAVRYIRSGDVKQVTLGLPKRVKDKIHKVIRAGLTTRGLVIGSVSVGFLVSVLESLCTGQVYLPTIMFIVHITSDSGTRAAAIGYLLLYNIMFVVPLLAILVMAYFGVKSETLGNLLRKRLALAKIVMAVLFAGLGVLVLVTS